MDELKAVQPEQQSGKKKHGCFFWGCLTAVIVSFLVVVVTSLVIYGIYRKALSFTSDQPATIAVYKPSQEEYKAVADRVAAFKKALQNGKEAKLILTANDINALIFLDPNMKELSGKAYLYIKDGQISADANMPLSRIPGFSGRYLNGTLGLKISLENGVLIVTAEKIVVNGQPLPEMFMKEMRNMNLAKDAYEKVETAEFIKKFKSIRIEGDKLVIIR